MPAVSVIFPVYGVEPYIEATLRSLLGQTFQDLEVILVDDESPDGSIAVAERVLGESTVPWRVIRQKNAGQGKARDNGIRQAQGTYVVCVDADDRISPLFLESLYRTACQGDYDAVWCGFHGGTADDSLYDGPVSFQEISREEVLHRFLCRTLIPILPGILMRRELLLQRELQAPEGCRFSEDVYFMWLLFSCGTRFAYTQAPLYQYIVRSGSTMTGSSMARMETGYRAFSALGRDPNFNWTDPEAVLILPRWVFGALHAAARILDYPSFRSLAEKMEFRPRMKEMKDFPERKARVLGRILMMCPRLFWQIIRWVE